ncbi:MAG: hypothetical protein IPG45_30220 [Deltaproteobacteria bacterium]|jgi:hypothetical protein|nr:hypothetical protein [Deltaproteobacteria bacterium]
MRNLPLHLTKKMLAGESMFASVEPTFPDAVAWVQLGRWIPKPGAAERYIIRHFEMPNKFRSGDWDVSNEELLYLVEHEVQTAEEADQLLDELVGDPSKFISDTEMTEYTPF